MKKKSYEKPAMRVVEIQHTGMLMTSGVQTLSGPNSSGYGTQEEDWYYLE